MLLFCISSISLLKINSHPKRGWQIRVVEEGGWRTKRCKGCYEFICLQFPKNTVLSSWFLKCKTAAPGPRTTYGHLPRPGSPVLVVLDTSSIPPTEAAKERPFLLAFSPSGIFWSFNFMRGNLYSKPLSLWPSDKGSLCPVTLALFQSAFPGLGAEDKEHKERCGGWGERREGLLRSWCPSR